MSFSDTLSKASIKLKSIIGDLNVLVAQRRIDADGKDSEEDSENETKKQKSKPTGTLFQNSGLKKTVKEAEAAAKDPELDRLLSELGDIF